jgi:serine protease inhibitor
MAWFLPHLEKYPFPNEKLKLSTLPPKFSLMKNRFVIRTGIPAILIPMLLISCSKTEETLPKNPVQINLTQDQAGVIESGNSFAFDIFRTIINNNGENENVILSPLSISSALSMAMNGAAGETRDSILNALRLEGITPEAINNSYKDLTESLLTVDKRVKITIANSVWTEDDFIVKQAFTDILKNYYNAESESFDIDDPETPTRVNKWIEDNTNGLIKNMIDKLESNTIMLLINAIYFKGKWKEQFDSANTVDLPFYRNDGTNVNVPTMKQENKFAIYQGSGFTMAEFPYGQGNFVMDIILPDSQDGISGILPTFNATNYATWTSRLDSMKVDLFFPRFKFGFKQDLKSILPSMGMGIAFSDHADFSNISDDFQLYINKALHQAFIETNEEGTEAAAATIIGIGVTSMPQVLELKLDHPFLFVIRETTTNAILFMGRISDPSQN